MIAIPGRRPGPPTPAAELKNLYAQYGIDELTRQAPQGATKPSGGAASQSEIAVVWKLRADKSLEPVAIETGITDHAYTQVIALAKGDLQAGDSIVTASVDSRAQGK